MPEKIGLGQCCGKKLPERKLERTKCALCNEDEESGSNTMSHRSKTYSAEASIIPSSSELPTSQFNPGPRNAISTDTTVTVLPTRQQSLDMIQLQFTGAPSPGLLLDPDFGYVVPENFSMVWKGVYRSSFPKEESFEFVRRLGLKSILTLFPEEYPAKNLTFMNEAGITHFQFGMPGNKEPFVNIPKEGVADALRAVLDRRNHPTLIHCNKGKHRTGCVVGCLRKIQQWGLTLIFDEYRRHSHPKSRALDQQFIELFDHSDLIEIARDNGWLPEHYPRPTTSMSNTVGPSLTSNRST